MKRLAEVKSVLLDYLRVTISDSSDSDAFEDSGSEYVPSDYDTDTESDDSVSSISDADDQQSVAMVQLSPIEIVLPMLLLFPLSQSVEVEGLTTVDVAK
ncbi:hypothetical protein RN001_002609 [Aquatica leii]|uniref:Uncharacterized protein n=1 Tax=Aquatica leii TaxID=1421715 RepID=A0AAN7QNL6_9COLE|nr:hypothetical protein RN001_002609 [Aquatica leii]